MPAKRRYRNLFAEFLEKQRAKHEDRSHAFWATRWGVSRGLIGLYAIGIPGGRVIGRKQVHIFRDIENQDAGSFTMSDYYEYITAPREN
jgi:hypothetical protein